MIKKNIIYIYRPVIVLTITILLGISGCASRQEKEISDYSNKPPIFKVFKEWREMNDQFIKYYVAGKYSIAENLANKALVFAEREFGHGHSNTLRSMDNLTLVNKSQGRYEESELLLIEKLILKKKILGSEHPSTLTSMNSLAILYLSQGRYKKAEPLFIKALTLNKKVLGYEHPNTLSSIGNLAMLYESQGLYEKAEPLLIESLALNKKTLGSEHPSTLSDLNNLASLYFSQGRYEKAAPLFINVLTLSKKILGQEHSRTLSTMNNLATLYQSQGLYEKAEPLFIASLALMQKTLGNEHRNTLSSMSNLAFLYTVMEFYEKAEPLYVTSLALKKKVLGEEHPDTLIGINNLADLYVGQGLYEKAEPLFIQSLVLMQKNLGDEHPSTLIVMGNLANLIRLQGHHKKATSLLIKLLALRKKVLGNEHPSTLDAIYSLALSYESQGNYKKAENLYSESLALRKKVLGNQHPLTLVSKESQAILYVLQGYYKKAKPLLIENFALREKVLGDVHPHTLGSKSNLFVLYQKLKQWEQAKTLIDSLSIDRNMFLQQKLWGAGEKTRLSYIQQQEPYKNMYLSFYQHLIYLDLNKPSPQVNQLAKQAWNISISRKGLLLQTSSDISALRKLHKNSDPDVEKLSQQLQLARSQMSSLQFSTVSNIKQLTQQQEDKINNLERQISNKVSDFRKGNKLLSSEDILSTLTSQQAVIDFLVYKEVDVKILKYKNEQLIAFVASKEHGVQFINLGKLAPIQKLIQSYREYISKGRGIGRERIIPTTSKALYQALWKPLTQALGDKKQIYLLPDGDLHLLPFKSLLNEQGEYLMQHVALTRISSVREIVYPKKRGKTNDSTIIADPFYGADYKIPSQQSADKSLKKQRFKQLPAVVEEAKQLQQTFSHLKEPFNVYLRKEASEAILNQQHSPRILHIATHGFFQETIEKPEQESGVNAFLSSERKQKIIPNIQNPLTRSVLALAHANDGVKGKQQADGYDGVLTALEVLDLNLEGTELVTLSACETNVGQVRVGEGVYSLNRAFLEAGAKAVLSTLWKVDDKGTSQFMQKFYQRFLDNQPAQQALLETQEEFKNSKDWNRPYYWAGFVMTGE